MGKAAKFLAVCAALAAAIAAGALAERKTRAEYVLEVKAAPAGTVITVDGVCRGAARGGTLEVRLEAPGEHLLKAEADGYLPRTLRLDCGAGRRAAEVRLEPVPQAGLAVESVPTGAAVMVDGHVRGRTPLTLAGLAPGRHAIEAAATNYLAEPREVELRAGETAREKFTLKNAQVQAYLARMARDPADISVYNDLGELYYVLGSYPEAAKAFVQGFIAAEKFANRDEPNSRNAGKLQHEARSKHSDPAFQTALNEAVLEAVQNGSVAPMVVDELGRISPAEYKDRILSAATAMVKANPTRHDLLLRLLDFQLDHNEVEAMLVSAKEFSERQGKNAGNCTDAARLLRRAYGMAPEAQRPEALRLLEDMLTQAEQRKPGRNEQADIAMQRGWIAGVRGDPGQHASLLLKAIELQTEARTANQMRLELFDVYWDMRDYANAREQARLASITHLNDDTVQKARQLLEKADKKIAEEKAKAEERARKEAEKAARQAAVNPTAAPAQTPNPNSTPTPNPSPSPSPAQPQGK